MLKIEYTLPSLRCREKLQAKAISLGAEAVLAWEGADVHKVKLLFLPISVTGSVVIWSVTTS